MVRVVLAAIIGIFVGGLVNICIIMISSAVIPPPAGVDMNTVEGMKAGMLLLEPKHFLFPFLAHALGSFVGALVAAIITAQYKMKLALFVGVFTMLGGVIAAMMIPAPTWFIAVDLILAYIPTAWIAGKLAGARELKSKTNAE